jgi:hypothetical protein
MRGAFIKTTGPAPTWSPEACTPSGRSRTADTAVLRSRRVSGSGLPVRVGNCRKAEVRCFHAICSARPGVQPALGRDFGRADDSPTQHCSVSELAIYHSPRLGRTADFRSADKRETDNVILRSIRPLWISGTRRSNPSSKIQSILICEVLLALLAYCVALLMGDRIIEDTSRWQSKSAS